MSVNQSTKPELCDAVYKLLFAGNPPHSPKIKALLPKAGTRNLYFQNWKVAGKPNGYERKAETEGATEGLVTGGRGVLPEPGVGQVQTEQAEVKQTEAERTEETEGTEEERAEQQEQQPKGDKGMEPSPGGADESETFAGLKVAGETLPFKVHLSVKTIALYEIAATEARDGLTLGRFLDTCAHDYFLGRGVDLGLVELGGKERNG